MSATQEQQVPRFSFPNQDWVKVLCMEVLKYALPILKTGAG